MPESQSPFVLIAMSSEDRGDGLSLVAGELGLQGRVFTDVETLLFNARDPAPEALIIEHALVSKVPQLDLIALLRRRRPLAEVPFVYLGPDSSDLPASVIASGADVYLPLPTRPEVIQAYLKRFLDKRQRERGLRVALEQSRSFEEAFKESERVKDDLIHMLVHDLKSPISSVMGLLDHSIEMIKASGADGVDELLSLARTESQHLLNLAANILDVRRMKEGHMPYSPSTVESLTELAKESLGDVRRRLGSTWTVGGEGGRPIRHEKLPQQSNRAYE